jgi:acyl-coenzyme A synthetase/AMP-(fatty) acid ligase/acyl carrier protein
VYGPTETTIWSTLSDLTHDETIHLGKPIANTHLLVVDSRHQPVPLGASGELLIAGDSVSDGYVHDQQADKFLWLDFPKIFSKKLRFYRTGDKVRLTHHGQLMYESRLDHQIKLRGYRIELNEIAHALKAIPNIKDAVVIPLTRSETRLVAFVLADEDIVVDEILNVLGMSLPNYMLPQSIIRLTEWPLTINCKINNFQLGVIYDDYINGNSDASDRPVNNIELILQTIWASSLQITKPAVDISFFNMGGSSLGITELLGEINHQFNISLNIRDFVNEPTISAQAKLISHLTNSTTMHTTNVEAS